MIKVSKMNESSQIFKVKPSRVAKPFKEFNNMLNNLHNFYSEYEDLIIPWDSFPELKGTNLVFEGGAGPNGLGTCKSVIPLKSATSVVIEFSKLSDKQVELLLSNGWTVE